MAQNGTALSIEHLYRTYKPLLVSIAYKMLGSISEAEDAVQDVFVSMSQAAVGAVAHPKAYLVKILTNRVLNMMKAAPRKRESYPGQWLPEPVFEPDSQADGPQESLLRQERLGYAMLVLLQTCTPPERAVFVLRESFGYEYADIAAILDKSEAACRKIYSRAAGKIGHRAHTEDQMALDASITGFVQSFAQALNTGRFETFLHLLTEDAVLLTDGGGIVRSALNPIISRKRVIAFFAGIARKGAFHGELHPIRLNGQPGLLLERGGQPVYAFVLQPAPGSSAVSAVYLISNPNKLKGALQRGGSAEEDGLL